MWPEAQASSIVLDVYIVMVILTTATGLTSISSRADTIELNRQQLLLDPKMSHASNSRMNLSDGKWSTPRADVIGAKLHVTNQNQMQIPHHSPQILQPGTPNRSPGFTWPIGANPQPIYTNPPPIPTNPQPIQTPGPPLSPSFNPNLNPSAPMYDPNTGEFKPVYTPAAPAPLLVPTPPYVPAPVYIPSPGYVPTPTYGFAPGPMYVPAPGYMPALSMGSCCVPSPR